MTDFAALYTPSPLLSPYGGTLAAIRRLTGGWGNYWPAVILGQRESYTVTGSASGGGVRLAAALDTAPERPWLEIGSDEEDVGHLVTFAPWDRTGERVAAVTAVVRANIRGRAGGLAPQAFWTVFGKRSTNQLYITYGSPRAHALPDVSYRTRLTVISNQGNKRDVDLKRLVCRS